MLAGSLLLVPIALLWIGCARNDNQYDSVESFEISSEYPGKAMRVTVSLPEGFAHGDEYTVLYCIPYSGGGAGLITRVASSDASTSRVLRENAVRPTIIVGVPHDGSLFSIRNH